MSIEKFARLAVVALGTIAVVAGYSIVGGGGAKWAELLLTAPLIVTLVHFCFFEAFVAPYLLAAPFLFVTRRARFQHALRRAVLWFRLEQGSGHYVGALDHLEQAIGLSDDPTSVEGCRRFRDALAAGRIDRAAQEADGLLKNMSPNGMRHPIVGRWIPLRKLIVPGALVSALAFALARTALSDQPGLTDAIITLAVCWLTWAVGRFGYELWYAWKSACDVDGFSTLVVRHEPTSGTLATCADDLYWRVGKLIVVHIDREMGDLTHAWVQDGVEHFVVPHAKMADAVTLLAGEADLVIAQTEDMDLAKQVLDLAPLPHDRLMALNLQSIAPPGHAWLEQASLMFDPAERDVLAHERPVLTRYSRRLPTEGAGWEVNVALISSICALWIPGGIFLSCVLVAVAATLIVLRDIAVVRRRSISRTRLRAPRNVTFSAALNPAALKFRLNVLGTLLAAACIAPVVIAIGLESDLVWLVLPGFAYLAIVLCTFIVLIGMRLTKWRIDRDFRIVVFRRNSGRFGYALIEHVMGIAGKYGQVLLLDHHTVQEYRRGPRDDHQGNTSHWSYYFAEPDLQIQMSDLRPDWQRTCLMELELADFAIFDWSEDVTDAMAWELEMAALNLPPERILVLLNSDVCADDAFAAVSDDLAARMNRVHLSRGSDDGYVWSNHDDFETSYADALSRMLRMLGDDPRAVKVVGVRGAWPVPTA